MPARDSAIDADFSREIVDQTVAGYVALRQSESAWAEELSEREELSGTLGDGLDQ